ncbi:inorganic pyrophosphatase Ppa [Thermodesulfobacteriota bacterium]
MTMTGFLGKAEKLEIQPYKRTRSLKELRNTHIPFTGSPLKHTHDPEIVILVSDPYSTNTIYYEFKRRDISYIEELPNLVNMEGETVAMVRLWIKKSSMGVRCTPFVVEDTWHTSG